MRKLPLFFIGCLIFAAGEASAVEIAGVGALNFSNTRGSNAGQPTTSPGTSLGFGALLTGTSGTFFNFELGALYIPRKFNINNAAPTTDQTLTMLEVPLLLRFSLPLISFGAGAYYARGLGNISTTVGGTSVQASYQAGNISQNDFGLTISAGLHLPIFPLVHLIVDARYNYGLINLISNPQPQGPTSLYLTDLQFLAGLSFTL